VIILALVPKLKSNQKGGRPSKRHSFLRPPLGASLTCLLPQTVITTTGDDAPAPAPNLLEVSLPPLQEFKATISLMFTDHVRVLSGELRGAARVASKKR
jgi:hypothetical protein